MAIMNWKAVLLLSVFGFSHMQMLYHWKEKKLEKACDFQSIMRFSCLHVPPASKIRPSQVAVSDQITTANTKILEI
jgi:hypothetical protein